MSDIIKKSILLVEDEALLAMNEKMQLEKYGYVVRTVSTGEEAVEAVKTSSDIDLILMDIDLGKGIDGTRAAEIILKDREIPIVFLSSHTEPEIVDKTEKITSYGYVVKSSSITVIDASIKMAFRLSKADRQLSEELTERRRAEESMREQRDFSESLIETAQTIILVLDARGCIVRFNPYTEELLGYSLDEVKGMNWVEKFVQPEDSQSVTTVLRKTIIDDQTRGNINLITAKDGRTILVEWYNKTLKDAYGHKIGVLATGHDITERKIAENAVQQLLSDKEMLIKEIRHRIKNNINTMTSLLSLQTQSLKEPTAIAALNDAINRLNSLGVLYDFLHAADARGLGPLKGYLQHLVTTEVELFPQGSQVEIHSEIEEYMCSSKTLSTLGLIVNEVVTNAMKYAFQDHPNPKLTLTGVCRDEHYILTIQDNGPGIPEPDESQTPSSFGLMIVNALTDQLNGNIKFRNNKGTQVTLEFPITAK